MAGNEEQAAGLLDAYLAASELVSGVGARPYRAPFADQAARDSEVRVLRRTKPETRQS
jgi:hypothetical protein